MATLNPLIATLLTMAGERNTITIPRAFVRFTGSLEAAMMLNQLLYWTPRAARAGDAIYKTDKDWQEELCLARYSVRKARERLEAMGFLTTEVRRAQGAPTVHYQLDYERLVECWSDWLKTNNGLSENEQSDYSNSDNGSSENEQTMDRLKTNNESVRNQTNMNKDYTKTPTEITPKTPPTPTTPEGDGDGWLYQELRKREISRVKASAISRMDVDPETLLTSIDNLLADGKSVGHIIGLIEDTPPQKGKPYARRHNHNDHAPHAARRSAVAASNPERDAEYGRLIADAERRAAERPG